MPRAALALARLAAAAAVWIGARAGSEPAYLGALVAAASFAVLDAGGARRSSGGIAVASAATFAGVLVGAFWLRPEVVELAGRSYWIAVAALAAPLAYRFIKHGSLVGYPTRAGVVAGWALAAAVATLVSSGVAWPVSLASALLAVAAIDDAAVTTLAADPLAAGHSLPDALRRARRAPGV